MHMHSMHHFSPGTTETTVNLWAVRMYESLG
jgi:hypothetical protein